MSNLIVLIGVVNLCIDCLLIKLNVVQLVSKYPNDRRLNFLEIRLMLKQLDQIKKLQDQLEVLGGVPEVKEFLEINKMVSSLRSSVRNEILNHLISKKNGFGVRQTLKPFIEDNIIDAHLSKDKKTLSGVLKGDKSLATFKLSHRSPYEIKASSMLKIEGWS